MEATALSTASAVRSGRGVGEGVGEGVGVAVGVGEGVAVGVGDGVGEGVAVGSRVAVAVAVGPGVKVTMAGVGVAVSIARVSSAWLNTSVTMVARACSVISSSWVRPLDVHTPWASCTCASTVPDQAPSMDRVSIQMRDSALSE